MESMKTKLKNKISQKQFVKIIAGIDNFDEENVRQVVVSAQNGGADAVDVAANAKIIEIAKDNTSLPVFVSSIVPQELAEAVKMGADAIEIGNFDALYKKGLRISAKEVIEITEKTIELAGKEVFLSVTVPGHLKVAEQIELAEKLEAMGVDLIQTEGAATVETDCDGARALVQKAHVSLANTIELSRNVSVPIMSASGITSSTAAMAFAAGASAVGVGSFVNKLGSVLEMSAAVMSVTEAVKSGKKAASREHELTV